MPESNDIPTADHKECSYQQSPRKKEARYSIRQESRDSPASCSQKSSGGIDA